MRPNHWPPLGPHAGGGRVEIKILGGGCPTCERLESLTRRVVNELGIDAAFKKVKDVQEIMAYDVITTPALVVDEEVKASGGIPRREEIRAWLQEASE